MLQLSSIQILEHLVQAGENLPSYLSSVTVPEVLGDSIHCLVQDIPRTSHRAAQHALHDVGVDLVEGHRGGGGLVNEGGAGCLVRVFQVPMFAEHSRAIASKVTECVGAAKRPLHLAQL